MVDPARRWRAGRLGAARRDGWASVVVRWSRTEAGRCHRDASSGGHGDRRTDHNRFGHRFRRGRLEHSTPPDWADRMQIGCSEPGDRRRLAGELPGCPGCLGCGQHPMHSGAPALPGKQLLGGGAAKPLWVAGHVAASASTDGHV
jgi:hypothetical protein